MVSLKSSAGQEIRRLLEWQEAVAKEAQEVGLPVSGYVRDLIMSELGVSIKDAERIARIFDDMITSSGWLASLDGTTFTKSFDPKNKDEEGQSEEHSTADGTGMVYTPKDLLRNDVALHALIDTVKSHKDVSEEFLNSFVHSLNLKAHHTGAKATSAKWDKYDVVVSFEDIPVTGKPHTVSGKHQ